MDYKGKSLSILLKDKTILRHKITEEPLASGGEGIIYRFEHKDEEKKTIFILKLYHSPHKAARNKAKVRRMFNNPVHSADPNVRFVGLSVWYMIVVRVSFMALRCRRLLVVVEI